MSRFLSKLKMRYGQNVLVSFAFVVMVGLSIHYSGLFYYDDYQSAYVPVFKDIGRALISMEYPLISQYSWVGGALAGEFQYGVFNIIQLVIIFIISLLNLTPYNFALLFTLTYLFILCNGIALVSDMWNFSIKTKTLFISISALNYFVLGWCGYDWVMGFASFAWLPWCWASLQDQLENNKLWHAVRSGVAFYLLLTLGYPFTIGMLAMVSVYLMIKYANKRSIKDLVSNIVLAWIFGVGFSSPAILMFVEYYLHTARSGCSGGLSMVWSVPVTAFLGLINPSWVSSWNMWEGLTSYFSLELFAGVVPPVVFLVLALSPAARAKINIGCELVFLFAIVLIMVLPSGQATYRWSFRWLPLFFLVLGVISSSAFELLNKHRLYHVKVFGLKVCVVFACGVFSLLIYFESFHVIKTIHAQSVQEVYFLFIALTFFVWSLAIRENSSFKQFSVGIPVFLTVLLFMLIYSFPIGTRVVPKWISLDNYNFDDATFRSDVRYIALHTQIDYFNQESANIILPSNTPMFGGVKFVNGYSPMMLENEHLLFGFLYSSSITIPRLVQLLENPLRLEKILNFLGIQGLVLGKTLKSKVSIFEGMGWNLNGCSENAVIMSKDGGVSSPVECLRSVVSRGSDAEVADYLYKEDPVNLKHVIKRTEENGSELPYAFSSVAINQIREGRNFISAAIKNNSLNENGLLMFRRAWYPGYRAFLDGEELPVLIADMLLPAVEIPKNRQGILVLVYDPISLRLGLMIFVISLSLAFLIVYHRLRLYGVKDKNCLSAYITGGGT